MANSLVTCQMTDDNKSNIWTYLNLFCKKKCCISRSSMFKLAGPDLWSLCDVLWLDGCSIHHTHSQGRFQQLVHDVLPKDVIQQFTHLTEFHGLKCTKAGKDIYFTHTMAQYISLDASTQWWKALWKKQNAEMWNVGRNIVTSSDLHFQTLKARSTSEYAVCNDFFQSQLPTGHTVWQWSTLGWIGSKIAVASIPAASVMSLEPPGWTLANLVKS